LKIDNDRLDYASSTDAAAAIIDDIVLRIRRLAREGRGAREEIT